MSNHTPSQQQRNGEHVLYCFNDDAITYGSRVNANDLKFDIVLEADKVVRLINPSSDPRLSWQRIRNHCHIDWGDGHVTKWYARVINSGRFNRNSEFIPQHEYKNANVGDRFTITVKCREPLVPIYCKLEKMWGEFPEDIYRVKSSPEADDDCGLFGECYHRDYPELSLLNKHRGTVHTIGPDLLVNWRNTDMTNMFSYFIALREVPVGLFRTVMGNVLSYENCFKGCDSLEKVDAGLLGLSNNVVKVLDSMFESCISLKNTIYLQNSESLISVKAMYKDCWKLNLCDEKLLNYCPNIAHADRIFMNDKMLNTLGPNVLKFSLDMETISEACRNTGMTQTYISIGKMSKLYNAERMYYDCMKLATITDGFFQNMGINASKEVNIDRIFMRAGDRTNGCVVPSKLCQPLGKVSRLKDYCYMWFFNFAWRGSDFPADIFRDAFKSGPNRKHFIISDMISYAIFPQATELELYNKLFTGNQENLIEVRHLFAGIGEISDYDYGQDGLGGGSGTDTSTLDRKPITYFNRDMFENLVNVTSVYRSFSDINIQFKFYEDIFKNNTKIFYYKRLFFGSRYKFNKFPIDYIIRTTSDDRDIDASEMYGNSDIRVYRPIHWSATGNVRYNLTDIVKNNIERPSVPIEFMLDGRTPTDPDYSFEYFPRGLEYIVQSNRYNKGLITLCMEPIPEVDLTACEIDWGDGTKETWRPTASTEEKTHTYTEYVCYKITIKSDKTPYFVKQFDKVGTTDDVIPVLEIRGEYPYSSFDGTYDPSSNMSRFMDVKYIDQSVYRICHHNGNAYRGTVYWNGNGSCLVLHPYLLKYCSNMDGDVRINNIEKLPRQWADVNDYDNLNTDLECIPPRFYENCVRLTSLKGMLNVGAHMIPDDIFPKVMLTEDEVEMTEIGGRNIGNAHTCNKLHLKTSMYRDWMLGGIADREQSDLFLSYPMLPYRSSWIQTLPYSYPLYEKLIFVVRDTTINGLGLERLVSGNIGEIRIEIFTDNGIIDKKVTINNDADLTGCIGDITGELNVINVYSKVPLWLDNHNIINEVRGVIPECDLNKTFKELAPNVTRIGEELFYRLTNRSFNNMFKDCDRLEQIPQRLFLCNTKVESFVSCFENCTTLDRIPDYLIVCYDHDIDCTSMFKGCTGIKHMLRPICDSVLGRVTVTDMFKGCKSTSYDLGKSFDEQVMEGIWYKGTPGLVKEDLTIPWQRATKDIPTNFAWCHFDNANIDNFKVGEITDGDIQKAAASTYIYEPINYFDPTTVITKPKELGKALDYRFDHIHFTWANAISMNNFCELTRYAYKMTSIQAPGTIAKDDNGNLKTMFSDNKLIPNKNFLFWNDWLIDTYALFRFATLLLPFHSSFMKMCERIHSISQIFYGTNFRHVDDVDVGGILGKNELGDIYLGAKSRVGELNLDVLFDRNIECLLYAADAFDWVKGNFNGDRLCLGECNPYNMVSMFANVDPDGAVYPDKLERQYPFTMYTFKNVWNNSNLSRHGVYKPVLTWTSFLRLNQKITSDDGLMKKMLSFVNEIVYDDAGNPHEHIGGQYLNSFLSEIDADCFSSLDPAYPIRLSDIFAGTKIKIMPKINHLVNLKSAYHLFHSVNSFENPIIPENYIKSDYQNTEVSLDGMFGLSNARVENQFIDITSTATFDPIASLEGCISTIGDDPEIFLGIKYNKDPAHHSRVNATGKVKNAFSQIVVTDSPNVPVHIEYVGDHTTSIKTVSDMEISWGDGSVNDKFNGKVDFAVLRHTYTEPGEYLIQIRCNEFMAYADTTDGTDIKTKFVGQLKTGNAVEVLKSDDGFMGMSEYFGNYVEEYEDNLFDNLSGCENVTKLNGVFSSHLKLKRVPADVYKPFINVTEIERDFMGSSSIDAIPEDIYKYNTKLTSLYENFANTSIGSIPKDLFVNNTEITAINGMFKATNLKAEGIPVDLFKPLTKLYEIIEPWSNCSGMIYEDDDRWNNILKYNTELVHIHGICADGHLNSIPKNIISTLSKLETAALFYYNDQNSSSNTNNDPEITIVPNELFSRNTKLVSVDRCFESRNNIKGVSSDIFKNNPRLNSFVMTFSNTGLKEIPKYIISDIHQEQLIDCSMMFAGCTDTKPMENEPISQHATRKVVTTDMLRGVRFKICEPEIFNGVHTKSGSYDSGYIWDTYDIRYNIRWQNDEIVPNYKLYPLFQKQVDNFEPLYIEKIIVHNTTKDLIHTEVLKRTFNNLNELNSHIIAINSYNVSVTNGDYFITRIFANKPLILEFDKEYEWWVGVRGLIPYNKGFNENGYNMDQFLTFKDPKYSWPDEFMDYYGSNDKKKVFDLSKIKFVDYCKNIGGVRILYNEAYADCSKVTRAIGLFSGITFNLAFSSGSDKPAISTIPPDFRKMSNLYNISGVFRDTKFMDYSSAVNWNSLRAKAWEPFDGLKKLNSIDYLYSNNICKLFKITGFSTHGRLEGIAMYDTAFGYMEGLFANRRLDLKIPYDYLDICERICGGGQKVGAIYTCDFDMSRLFRNTAITTIMDNGKVFMQDFRPEIGWTDGYRSGMSIELSEMFYSDLSNGEMITPIPSNERILFLNSLFFIKDETIECPPYGGNITYKEFMISLDRFTPFKYNDNIDDPVDVTPFLLDGKILNIKSKVETFWAREFNGGVPLINIPAGAIALPDTVTSINITDMFKNCVAHPDVTDISQVFVYNGSLQVDWSLSGLKLYGEGIS